MQAAAAFYGITLGPIAVGAWSASREAEDKVAGEAAELAGLYRDVSCLPDPVRGELQDILRRYTCYTIDEAWPLQRAGKVPGKGVGIMTELTAALARFEPRNGAGEVLMQECFDQFNRFHAARRLRLQAVESGLPAVLWVVVFAGAAITIGMMWCFVMASTRVHALFVGLLAALLALLIFITAAMDNPFRGAFGLGAEPFELTYEQLMQAG